jgi:hypothetical protein
MNKEEFIDTKKAEYNHILRTVETMTYALSDYKDNVLPRLFKEVRESCAKEGHFYGDEALKDYVIRMEKVAYEEEDNSDHDGSFSYCGPTYTVYRDEPVKGRRWERTCGACGFVGTREAKKITSYE